MKWGSGGHGPDMMGGPTCSVVYKLGRKEWNRKWQGANTLLVRCLEASMCTSQLPHETLKQPPYSWYLPLVAPHRTNQHSVEPPTTLEPLFGTSDAPSSTVSGWNTALTDSHFRWGHNQVLRKEAEVTERKRGQTAGEAFWHLSMSRRCWWTLADSSSLWWSFAAPPSRHTAYGAVVFRWKHFC